MARPGLRNNPKFKRLMSVMKEPYPHVRGYLEALWEVAYESGDEVIGSPSMVEDSAEYPGMAGKLFKALLEAGGDARAGFIELVPGRDDIYQIHDLFENAPSYVKKRLERDTERKAAGRTISDVRRAAALIRWKKDKSDDIKGLNYANVMQMNPFGMQTDANGTPPCTLHPAPIKHEDSVSCANGAEAVASAVRSEKKRVRSRNKTTPEQTAVKNAFDCWWINVAFPEAHDGLVYPEYDSGDAAAVWKMLKVPQIYWNLDQAKVFAIFYLSQPEFYGVVGHRLRSMGAQLGKLLSLWHDKVKGRSNGQHKSKPAPTRGSSEGLVI